MGGGGSGMYRGGHVGRCLLPNMTAGASVGDQDVHSLRVTVTAQGPNPLSDLTLSQLQEDSNQVCFCLWWGGGGGLSLGT